MFSAALNVLGADYLARVSTRTVPDHADKSGKTAGTRSNLSWNDTFTLLCTSALTQRSLCFHVMFCWLQ